jgi:hypothetical protein
MISSAAVLVPQSRWRRQRMRSSRAQRGLQSRARMHIGTCGREGLAAALRPGQRLMAIFVSQVDRIGCDAGGITGSHIPSPPVSGRWTGEKLVIRWRVGDDSHAPSNICPAVRLHAQRLYSSRPCWDTRLPFPSRQDDRHPILSIPWTPSGLPSSASAPSRRKVQTEEAHSSSSVEGFQVFAPRLRHLAADKSRWASRLAGISKFGNNKLASRHAIVTEPLTSFLDQQGRAHAASFSALITHTHTHTHSLTLSLSFSALL